MNCYIRKIFLFLIISVIFVTEAFCFTDEESFLWAKNAIDKWNEKGIISGYADGTFRGNSKVTRAEAVAVINRLNNSNEKTEKRPAKDVYKENWFFNDMGIALKNGIIKLDENGNLRPNDFATREEVFVMFGRLFNLKYGGNSYEYLAEKFNDYGEIGYNNLDIVAGVTDAGFVRGDEKRNLRPKDSITRAELVAMINSSIEDIYESGKISNKTIKKGLIINGNGVKLNNVDIGGKIYVLDGAKDNPPYLTNTTAAMGINSRVGEIELKREDIWETETEIAESKPEPIEPISATIKYSKTRPTDENVKVTVKIDNKRAEIVNNNGKDYYVFKKNGEFTFVVKDENGNLHEIKTEVNNIDKVTPKIAIQTEAITEGTRVKVIKTKNPEEKVDLYYKKGSASESEVIKKGTAMEEATFEADTFGTYTIVAEDEAGNISKEIITLTGECTVNVICGNNGTITPGTKTIKSGNDLTFTITPDEGYSIKDVLADERNVGSVATYTFRDIDKSHTLSATFSANSYVISFDSNGGNDVSNMNVNFGSEYGTLPLPVKEGFAFEGWYTEETEDVVGGNRITNTTVVNTLAAQTLYAKWVIQDYTITVIEGENGSIAPTGEIGVVWGDDREFTVTPNEGYHVDEFEVNGESAVFVGGVYSLTDIKSDYTLSVTFSAHNYSDWDITVPASCIAIGERKRVCADCGVEDIEEIPMTAHNYSDTYSHDSTEHYYACLTAGCTVKTGNTLHSGATIENNGTCTECGGAYRYVLTLNTNLAAGGTATGGGLKDFGDEVTISAVPNTGYEFTSWTVNSGTVTLTGSEFTMPKEAVQITANFDLKNLTISFNANGGTGNMESQSLTALTPFLLSANVFEKAGCTFTGWSIDPGSREIAYEDKETGTFTDDLTLYAVWGKPNEPAFDEDNMEKVAWRIKVGTEDIEPYEPTTNEDWYNYTPARKTAIGGINDNSGVIGDGTGKWANVKTTKNGIDSYWVWIPRFTYKIVEGNHSIGNSWNADVLLDGSENSLNTGNKIKIRWSDGIIDDEDYTAHPAFTIDTGDGSEPTELTGIWVAKYEASKDDATLEDSGIGTEVSFRPGVKCWTNINISDSFDVAKSYNEDLDSHMMKNTEWGAVAYLTNAIGRIPYRNNRGVQEEDYNGGMTGYSGRIQKDNTYIDADKTFPYDTFGGVKASTTHNIYGIYDMNGGMYDRVSAYILTGDTDGRKLKEAYQNSGANYVDHYTERYSDTVTGDAVYETSNIDVSGSPNKASWDKSNGMIREEEFYFLRGGWYRNEGAYTGDGIFAFSINWGSAKSFITFRAVCRVIPVP